MVRVYSSIDVGNNPAAADVEHILRLPQAYDLRSGLVHISVGNRRAVE